jgi:hypothetical protein
MNAQKGFRPWHLLFPRRLLCPAGLLHLAALLALGFGALHGLGLRDYTAVLSGTSPGGGGISGGDALLCVLYVAGYFAALLGVPILTLAGLANLLLTRLLARGRPPTG